MSELVELAVKLRLGLDRESVFGPKVEESDYRRMRSLFHPDKCMLPDASALFHAIQSLWEGRGNPFDVRDRFTFPLAGGSVLMTHPLSQSANATGGRVVTNKAVGYLFKKEYRHLAAPFYDEKHVWKFAGPGEMRKQCLTGADAFLPQFEKKYDGRNGDIFISLKKSPTAIPLDMMLKQQGGKLDMRHVAWILSGLYNAFCYMQFASIVHLGLEPSAVFVEPGTHRVSLPGGWGHAVFSGALPRPVPTWVASALPRRYRGAKKASYGMTSELILAIGRHLLGDPTGIQLGREKQTRIIRHLLSEANGTAIEQYKNWQQATSDAFGGHHFHKMDQALVEKPSIVYS